MPFGELVNGLLFLYDDVGCMRMPDRTIDGGVGDIYLEYNGEQDEEEEKKVAVISKIK